MTVPRLAAVRRLAPAVAFALGFGLTLAAQAPVSPTAAAHDQSGQLLAAGVSAGDRPIAAPGPAEELAIVVHRSNPVDNLTRVDLRRIFLFEKQTWPQGRNITVVLRERGQPERTEAIRLLCGLSDQD